MNRKFGVLFLAASLTAFAACSGGGSTTNPNQAEINTATADFAETATLIFEDFNGVVDCQDFQDVINSYTGTPVACDSGTVTVTVVSSSCDDGPPLFAEATFSVVADNCQDNDFNTLSDGSLQMDLDYEGSNSGDVNVSSTGIDVNGLNFDFDNFLVTVSASANTVTCTGNMSVDGDSCTLASDCDSCAF